ncbi:MAG: tetratricopeptide repeat protein [Planctomycetota bacterium]
MRSALFVAAAAVLGASAAWAVPLDQTGADTGAMTPGPEGQATAYLRAGQPGLAISVLKKALTKAPNSARLHYHLGMAYSANKQPDLAEAQFRTVLQEDADYVDAHVQIAELLGQKISPTEPKANNLRTCVAVANELAQAVKKSPQRAELYYVLAVAHLRCVAFREKGAEADFTEAVNMLEKAKALEPEEVKPYSALGNVYVAQATFTADRKKLSELQGDTAREVNDLLGKAEASYRKVLAVDPGALGALDQVAAIHNLRGDLKKAVQVYEEHIPKLKEPGQKAACYRQMGVHLMQANDLGGAEAKLNQAIKTEPKDLASYLLLARVLDARMLPDAAGKALAESLKINPMFLNAQVELGLYEARRRNLVGAERHFELALSIPPDRAAALSLTRTPVANVVHDLYITAAVQLGNILAAQSRFGEAISVFRRLAAIVPRSPVPDFEIGEIYRRQGMFNEAKGRYANALRRSRTFVRARIALAEVAVAEAQAAGAAEERAELLGQAIAQYEIVLKLHPENAAVLARMATLRFTLAGTTEPKNRAELERALANIQAALKLEPDSNTFRSQLASIQHGLGNKKAAIVELKKLIESAKKIADKEPDNLLAILRLAELRGLLHAWQPDKAVLKQAVEGLALAVEKDPGLLRAYEAAGMMLFQDKDYKGAVEWYKKLLEVTLGEKKPEQLSQAERIHALQAAAQLAWIYCDHLGDPKQAKQYGETALKFDPNLPALLDTWGWIHYKAGEYDKAIPPLRRAFKGAPNNPTIGYHLGATLIKLNNPDRAREALKSALEHVRDNPELKAKIDKLLKMAGN